MSSALRCGWNAAILAVRMTGEGGPVATQVTLGASLSVATIFHLDGAGVGIREVQLAAFRGVFR